MNYVSEVSENTLHFSKISDLYCFLSFFFLSLIIIIIIIMFAAAM